MSDLYNEIYEAIELNDAAQIKDLKEKLIRNYTAWVKQKSMTAELWEAAEGMVIPETENYETLVELTQSIEGELSKYSDAISYFDFHKKRLDIDLLRQEINSLAVIAPSIMRDEYITRLIKEGHTGIIEDTIKDFTERNNDIVLHIKNARATIKNIPVKEQNRFNEIFRQAEDIIDGLQNDITFLYQHLESLKN